MAENDVNDELLDYDEVQETTQDRSGDGTGQKDMKGTYVAETVMFSFSFCHFSFIDYCQ